MHSSCTALHAYGIILNLRQIAPMRLFRNKKLSISGSLNRSAWHRIRRNPMAMTSLAYILLVALLASAGYLITPDKSPMANRQHLELGTRKPGFSVEMMALPKSEQANAPGPIATLLFGRPDQYRYIPVDTVVRSADGIRYIPYPAGPWATLDASIAPEEVYVERSRFLLGTDRFGRDLLSRLLVGARVSLSVGFISVFISLLIGMTLGAVAGYFKGRTDDIIVWLINVVWSIPTLLLVIAITFALGKGFWQVFIAVGLTMWVEVARVVRGQVLSIREKEFVEAGRALGFSNTRIIFRHILPNVLAPVIVISAANFASAILIEAGLSFLGIGVQPPMPSWGTMIRENYAYIILDKAYLAILPGLCIMSLVLAFMLLGNALRDALDVRTVNSR